MTWEELSKNQSDTAKHLIEAATGSYDRAVCGRAYYAAYSLTTSKLPKGMTFSKERQNPDHGPLPKYVNNIQGLSQTERISVKKALRRLRHRREDADYRPGISVTRSEAKESLRDAEEIRRILS